jgi:hypothetical protein
MKLPQPTNIIEAWESPDYFRSLFGKDLSSWKGWRTFLKALYGIPFADDEERLLFQLGTLRETPSAEGYPEAYAIVGRRGGKSRISSLIAAYEAVLGGWSDRVAAGERAWVFVLATDKAQAGIILNYCRAFLHLFDDPKEPKKSLVEREGVDEVHLRNGISVAVKPCTFRASRGYSTCCVIADEIAFWRDENSANPAAEVITSILPGMIPGSRLIGISTPYGRMGFLYDIHREHFGKAESDFLVWQADTRTMNPLYDEAMIRRLVKRDPIAMRAEYDAQFREDVTAFLPLELIELSMVRQQALPAPGYSYTCFVDPSGGRHDSMTLAVAHCEGEKIILDRIEERHPPFDPQAVVKEFSDVIKAYGCHSATSDRFGGVWVSDSFQKAGVRMDMSDLPASDLYLNFAALLNSGRVELVEHDRLKVQLQSLERRTGQMGKDKVDHPPGLHDDLANAVAGAVVMASHDRAWTAEEQEARMPRAQSGRPAELIRPEERATQLRRAAETEVDQWMRENGCSPILRR